MAVYDKVRADEFNTVQAKVSNVLGTGSATYGYGQPTASSAKTAHQQVKASDWDLLRNDIASISRHQDSSWAGLTDIAVGQKIRYDANRPSVEYDARIDGLIPTRFNISASSAQVVNKGSVATSTQWNTAVSTVATFTFSNANEARWFFNSGSKVRLSSTLTGSSSNPQNAAWTSLLASAGITEFGADASALVQYYELTNAYQTIHETASSGIYAYYNNIFRISAKCNVANNSAGTATAVYFYVQWIDTYDQPWQPNDGKVDGTLSLLMHSLEPAGALYPTGTFTVESPTVTTNGITGS